jgi:UDP:flavonoid glycosyltransferase YjiC (YdhE family)
MLTLGFFFDQLLNALRLSESGVVLALDKANFSTEDIVAKVRTLLQDEESIA